MKSISMPVMIYLAIAAFAGSFLAITIINLWPSLALYIFCASVIPLIVIFISLRSKKEWMDNGAFSVSKLLVVLSFFSGIFIGALYKAIVFVLLAVTWLNR